MKITKINQNRSFIVNLKFLKTKNYFLHNLTFKNIQSKFVKGLKVISKYNAYNKKIIFFNNNLHLCIIALRLKYIFALFSQTFLVIQFYSYTKLVKFKQKSYLIVLKDLRKRKIFKIKP